MGNIRSRSRDSSSNVPLHLVLGIVFLLIVGIAALILLPTDGERFEPSDIESLVRTGDLAGLERLAEDGNADAQYWLARALASDTPMAVADPVESIRWFRLAAEQNHAPSQMELGTAYAMGFGVERDTEKALKWLTRSAEQDHLDAQKLLGVLYLGKDDFPVDDEKAFKWTLRAAQQGDGESQFNTAVYYLRGIGVFIDEKEYDRWLALSAQSGYQPAIRFLQAQSVAPSILTHEQELMQMQQQILADPNFGGSAFGPDAPFRYVPPEFKEAQRRAEEAMRQQRY